MPSTTVEQRDYRQRFLKKKSDSKRNDNPPLRWPICSPGGFGDSMNLGSDSCLQKSIEFAQRKVEVAVGIFLFEDDTKGTLGFLFSLRVMQIAPKAVSGDPAGFKSNATADQGRKCVRRPF